MRWRDEKKMGASIIEKTVDDTPVYPSKGLNIMLLAVEAMWDNTCGRSDLLLLQKNRVLPIIS